MGAGALDIERMRLGPAPGHELRAISKYLEVAV